MNPTKQSGKYQTGTQIRVACIGEAMVELSLGKDSTTPPALAFAGDTLNTAIYLKRLMGNDTEVSFITALGTDPLSDRMIDFINSESISTGSIQRITDKLPGLYAITTDALGERSFSYWRSESAARTLFQKPPEEMDFAILEQYNVLYLTAITLAILPDHIRVSLLDWLRNHQQKCGATIVFDSNYRPALWQCEDTARKFIATAWQIADIALPSIDDEMSLFKDSGEADLIERFNTYGVDRGVLKRGVAGPRSLSASSGSSASATAVSKGAAMNSEVESSNKITFTAVSAIDSTAAGDSFNAGYLSIALNGGIESDAMIAGHQCASRVIQHPGAIVPLSEW